MHHTRKIRSLKKKSKALKKKSNKSSRKSKKSRRTNKRKIRGGLSNPFKSQITQTNVDDVTNLVSEIGRFTNEHKCHIKNCSIDDFNEDDKSTIDGFIKKVLTMPLTWYTCNDNTDCDLLKYEYYSKLALIIKKLNEMAPGNNELEKHNLAVAIKNKTHTKPMTSTDKDATPEHANQESSNMLESSGF